MKIFNFGKKGEEKKQSEDSLIAHFNKSAGAFATFDEKTSAEKLREQFPRSVFDMKYDVVRHDASGARTTESVFAFDESTREAASQDTDGRSAFRVTPQRGDSVSDVVWAHFEGDAYIGWSACAILAQNPIIHLACHIPAEDAIASGFELKFADNDEADINGNSRPDNDLLTAIKTRTDEMKMRDVCVKLEYNKVVFGFGIAMPLITKKGKPLDMSHPFNADGLKGCEYRGFKVIDPYWLTPQFEQGATQDPLNPRFMKPTWYKLPDGRLIHHTWFIKVDNAEVADILKPTYYYGGMPLTQMIFKRVWCAEKTANEAPLLAQSKRMLVVDANVQQIVKNKSYVYKLMQIISKCRTNWGVFFKSPTSNIQQIDTSLSDFEDCMFSQYQLVASIAQMPATKLLQTTPKGFNSTGEFEWKIYAQKLITIQEREYIPLLEKHIKILTAINGHARDISVVFNPVDAPSEKERAEIESTKSQTRCNYVQNGILSPEEVRSVLRNDEEGDFTSISEEAPASAELEERADLERKLDADEDGEKDEEK